MATVRVVMVQRAETTGALLLPYSLPPIMAFLMWLVNTKIAALRRHHFVPLFDFDAAKYGILSDTDKPFK